VGLDGLIDGPKEGLHVERADGDADGRLVGLCDGLGEGSNEEERLGDLDGSIEGG